MSIETAQAVFARGFAPNLSEKALRALLAGCESNDKRLIQHSTTEPPPLQCVQDWLCEGACSIGYAGWHGDGLETVGEVEEYFAKACFQADATLGEPAACRHFLHWFDDVPRDEMRVKLAEWIRVELTRRVLPDEQPTP